MTPAQNTNAHPARTYPRSYRVDRLPPCPISSEGIHDFHWLPIEYSVVWGSPSVAMRCSLCGQTCTWKTCPHNYQQWGDDMRWVRCTICGQHGRRQVVNGVPV